MEKLMNGYITTYNDRMYTFVVVSLSMKIIIIIFTPSTFFKRLIIIG